MAQFWVKSSWDWVQTFRLWQGAWAFLPKNIQKSKKGLTMQWHDKNTFVFCCCHKNLTKTWWLRQAQIYFLIILQARVRESSSVVWSVGRLFPSQFLRKNTLFFFLIFPGFQRISHSWPVSPFLISSLVLASVMTFTFSLFHLTTIVITRRACRILHHSLSISTSLIMSRRRIPSSK